MEVKTNSMFEVDGNVVSLEELIEAYRGSKVKDKKGKSYKSKADIKRADEQKLKPYQAELIKLQKHLEKTSQKMIILFEGRDAAGKGGTIRRVTRYMDEKHYRVVALGKPTEEQKSQWFYQKYVQYFPVAGEIVLFDRSWYNRAMVESVFNFCTQREYDDFMKGVKGFENDLVRQGIILIKLYYSVTKDEQARRFERRKNDPLRQWKLSEIDMQAQEKWDEFTTTKYNMIKQTHSHRAPWTIIRSKDKIKARLESLKVILHAVDYEGREESLNYALDSDIVISGAREIEIMDAQISSTGKFIG
ncbi:MAG: polyphosphate kinase 2 [Sulfurimonas sp.]|nr:polyphosphate kinase 2 [Sulfurimonas sp.]